jgi:hypothetical protein
LLRLAICEHVHARAVATCVLAWVNVLDESGTNGDGHAAIPKARRSLDSHRSKSGFGVDGHLESCISMIRGIGRQNKGTLCRVTLSKN